MSRKNSTRRRPQARRKADGTRGGRKVSPPPLEAMVLPQGRCSRSGKLCFTATDAAKALRHARASRAARGQAYHEERTYDCKACGFHHLTSRAEFEERS